MKVISTAVVLLLCNQAVATHLKRADRRAYETDFIDMDDNDAEIDQQIVFDNGNTAEAEAQ